MYSILVVNIFSAVVFAQEKAVSCINFFSEMDYDLMDRSPTITVKSIVSNFCTAASDYKCAYDWYYFDAKQSVFLSILCSNVWKTWMYLSDNLMTGETALLKKYKFVSFDVHNYIDQKTKQKSSINYCDYTISNMNNCDLSYFVPHIFDILMNDFFNIRQASNMWISNLSWTFEKEKYANTYVNQHFPWLSIQKGMEWGICESKYYTQTCKYLKNYMSQVRNLLTTTDVINVKNLFEVNENVKCDTNFDSNILYCGLLGSQSLPLYSLLRAVYNEYFWYDLFMSYYQYNLLSQAQYLWEDEVAISFDEQIDSLKNFRKNLWSQYLYDNLDSQPINIERAYKSQEQVYRSKQAISQALLSLSRVEYSLPIHVWFLMYQEDLKLFMWSLPKIYTPLRTLSDKLQNVQDADS